MKTQLYRQKEKKEIANKKKKEVIIKILEDKNYDKIDDDEEYKYLVKMPMDSVSEENVSRIMVESDNKHAELEILKTKTVTQMWIEELDCLRQEYVEYMIQKQKSCLLLKFQKKVKRKK